MAHPFYVCKPQHDWSNDEHADAFAKTACGRPNLYSCAMNYCKINHVCNINVDRHESHLVAAEIRDVGAARHKI